MIAPHKRTKKKGGGVSGKPDDEWRGKRRLREGIKLGWKGRMAPGRKCMKREEDQDEGLSEGRGGKAE